MMPLESALELDDIQSGVLRPRPTPYVATYIGFRIDDRKAGRDLMRRVSQVVTSAANPNSPLADTWVSVALTYQGLKALVFPQQSLDSFSRIACFCFAVATGRTAVTGPSLSISIAVVQIFFYASLICSSQPFVHCA